MKKIVKIIGYSLMLFLLSNSLLYNEASAISRSELTQIVQNIIPGASPGSGTINYVSVAQEIQYWIFALVGVLSIIYIVWA